MATKNKLTRARQGKVIAGVCRGIADFFGISAFWVRLGFVVFGLTGAGELVYIIMWIVVPKARR